MPEPTKEITEIDFTDPKVIEAMEAEVAKRTAAKDAEYDKGLQNLYQYSDVLDHPMFSQFRDAVRSGKPVKLGDEGSPTHGNSDSGANAFDTWFSDSQKRLLAKGVPPEMAAAFGEENKAMARELMNSGGSQIDRGTAGLKDQVKALEAEQGKVSTTDVVQRMYFADSEVFAKTATSEGTTMKDLAHLGISSADVIAEIDKYAPGSPPQPIIKAMLAERNAEHFVGVIKDERQKAENTQGLPGAGPSRTLKIDIEPHVMGERPSLRKIAVGIGHAVGKSEQEVEAHFAKVD